jgi:dipeptidyl aminopeptidase/acylaminoacyl peptidase
MRLFNPVSILPLLLVCALGAQRLPADTLANMLADGLSEPSAQVQSTLPRYLQSRSAQFVDWLSDGSMLIATRFGDTQQIHRVSRPLGAREQVSFATDGVVAAQARPYASDALVYLEPLHGGQSDQLFLQHLDTHELTALTDGNHRDGAARWAHDGKHLAFASNRLNSNDTAIYELDTDASAAVPRLLAGGSGEHWRLLDWSGDDARVLLGREQGTDTATVQLYIVEVDSGEITPLGTAGATTAKASAVSKANPQTPLMARDARFATDGHGILMLTTQSAPGQAAIAAESVRLVYLDLHSQQWHDLASNGSHDVQRFAQSADGRYIAYTLRENGVDQLMLIDQTRKLDLSVPQLPLGLIGNLKFDVSGQHLGLSVESTRSPQDVWVYEPETHALTQWTHSEVGPIDVTGFALPQALHFPTWDRIDGKARELSALVYRSAALADTAGPRPVVIALCAPGGSLCEAGFEPFIQFLVNELGVVVVAPTMRTQPTATDELREDSVRDIGSLLVWIGLQRELDRNRVALLGEAVGGYVALQALADYGDRLRAGVAAFAPHQSALGHASAIRKPVLLVQGLNNPSAPPYELDQLRARLRAEGVEVQSLAAPEEGTGFDRKSHRDAYHEVTANFLAQWLR